MGSPARRLINPITRCWANPNYGYAGTDDRRGTDQRLDTKRLTLMSERFVGDGRLRLSGRKAASGTGAVISRMPERVTKAISAHVQEL
jgi:hypothetical protein